MFSKFSIVVLFFLFVNKKNNTKKRKNEKKSSSSFFLFYKKKQKKVIIKFRLEANSMYQISFKFKSFDLDTLNQCEKFLLAILRFCNLDQVKNQHHPRKCKKITVCRSPHIDKKSREQFQILTYKKTLVYQLSDHNVVLVLFEILKTSNFLGSEVECSLDYSTF